MSSKRVYSSVMDFNKLNSELYQLSAPHRFARKPSEIDRGYLKMSNWLNDLCFYFEQKRKHQELDDEDEFKSLIEDHRAKVNKLVDSDYKRGLLKALNDLQ